MPEIHLRLDLYLFIVLVDHLQKTKKEYKKFRETEDSRYIYQNELDKTCFQHDMRVIYLLMAHKFINLKQKILKL